MSVRIGMSVNSQWGGELDMIKPILGGAIMGLLSVVLLLANQYLGCPF